MMKITATVAFLLAWLPFSVSANAETLKGKVGDFYGAFMPNSYVFAFNNELPCPSINALPGKSTMTTRIGDFQLDLDPGFYDVCVFHSGFTAVCKKIFVTEKTNKKIYKFRMLPDPLVTKEKGDFVRDNG
jgi:hypothetical protein